MSEIPVPEDYLTIKLGKESKELFMSSGLLRIICSLINLNGENVTCIYVDPDIQERILLEVLAERTERGQPVVDIAEDSLMAYPLNREECDKIIKWVGEHALYFFIVSTATVAEQSPEMEKKLEELNKAMEALPTSGSDS